MPEVEEALAAVAKDSRKFRTLPTELRSHEKMVRFVLRESCEHFVHISETAKNDISNVLFMLQNSRDAHEINLGWLMQAGARSEIYCDYRVQNEVKRIRASYCAA
jgi:hypothetical protein